MALRVRVFAITHY